MDEKKLRVVLLNGSPHERGCTYTGLSEVAGALEKEGVATELIWIGNAPIRGCIACGRCKTLGKCVFDDDICNEITDRLAEADGIVVGSPVYYAGPNGTLCALLDRIFYSGGQRLKGKGAAATVNCRRGGASASFDRLNKYFTINEMPVATSQYWNSTHGFTPEDVKKDLEGLQTMRTLGNNMAWLLKTMSESKNPLPEREKRVSTNFI